MEDKRSIQAPIGEDEFGFDWGSPGERPFVGGNERQCRFAFGRLQGFNQIEAARLAGYQGDTKVLATQGSRAAHSATVGALMAAAQAARGEQLAEACNPDEVLRRLSMAMRSPGVKPAEIAQLSNAFKSLEQQIVERKKQETASPQQILDELLDDMGPEFLPLVIRLAEKEFIDWTPKRDRLNGNSHISEVATDQPSAPASPSGDFDAGTERAPQ